MSQQTLDVVNRVFFVGCAVVGVTRLGVMGASPAEFLHLHVFAGHRLNDVRSGDEHVRGLINHHGEVGDSGGVHGATSTRPQDQRDLRDDSGSMHIALENFGVQTEGNHTFLDACATGVVDANHRAASLEREVHDLDDLLAKDFTQRSTKDSEVLGKDGDWATVNGSVSGHDTVAVGAVVFLTKVDGAVAG